MAGDRYEGVTSTELWPTMDEHSREVVTQDGLVGLVMWHPTRPARLEIYPEHGDLVIIPLSLMKQILDGVREITGREHF